MSSLSAPLLTDTSFGAEDKLTFSQSKPAANTNVPPLVSTDVVLDSVTTSISLAFIFTVLPDSVTPFVNATGKECCTIDPSEKANCR